MRHVVALSGGKDSTALALALREREPREYQFVCTPTGDELPDMVDHLAFLHRELGGITPLTCGRSLAGLVREQKALPNWRMRFCTRQLKIEPFLGYMMRIAPATAYVGLRADEPERQGTVYDDVPGVEQRFPLREWGWNRADVESYLAHRGVVVPERTDCARCFFQTLGEWWLLWKNHPLIYASAEAEEEATGHTYRSPGRDSWPASLRELRVEFEKGAQPRGVSQTSLFDGGDAMRRATCRVCTL